MTKKTSAWFQIVIASAILVCTDAIRTGPYLQWTTDASKIPPPVLTLVDGPGVRTLLKTVTEWAPSAAHPYSVLLFIEPEVETFNFLMNTGAYAADTSDKTDRSHGYLKTIVGDESLHPLLNNYAGLTSENHVEEALATLSDEVSACVVTDDSSAMYRLGNKVRLVSSANLSSLSPVDCFITLVNLGNGGGSTLESTYARFAEAQRVAGVGVLSVYASVAASTNKKVVTERRMQELDGAGPEADDDAAPLPTLYELPIQPYQLSAVLTLSFMGMMVVLVVSCLMSIDTPKIFEDKTIPVNKEY